MSLQKKYHNIRVCQFVLIISFLIQASFAKSQCGDLASRTKVPLGNSISGTGEIDCYKIYVPTKWGGILTITTTQGTIADLKYPNGTAYANGTEIGENKHGWYTFKVTGALKKYEVSNTFLQTGKSKIIPYNFFYFPFSSADARRLLFDVTPEEGAMKKYDKFVGGTAAFDWEVAPANKHKDPGGVANWWGHCGGATSASILYEQPSPPSANPHGIVQDEIEGLLAELGKRCTYNQLEGNWPGRKPANGVDPTDKNADNFHRRLRDFTRIKKKALFIRS